MAEIIPRKPIDSDGAAGDPAYRQDLTRSLGVWGNVMITLSGISPASSVFIIGAAAFALAGTGVFLAYIAAAVIGIAMALCYAELVSRYPVTGGDYSLIARAANPTLGFVAFVMILVGQPLIVAVFALGTVDYLAPLNISGPPVAVAIAIVVITTAVACFSVRSNAWVTGLFLGIELVALLIVAAVGLANVERPATELLTPVTLDEAGGLVTATVAVIAATVAQAIFSYNGYGGAAYFAEETHQPARNVARSVLYSLAITVVAQLIPLTAVLLSAPELNELFGAEIPMDYFLTARTGPALTNFIVLGVALAILNAVIVINLSGGRLVYSAARDNAFPKPISSWLRTTTRSTHTPARATIVIGGIAVGACFMPIDTLLTITGATLVFGYSLIALAALSGRRHPLPRDRNDVFTMRLWPLPPVFALIAMGYVLWSLLTDPTTRASVYWSVAIVIAGLGYYLLYLRPRRGTHWTMLDPIYD